MTDNLTPESAGPQDAKIEKQLRSFLGEHGYCFQYAIAESIRKMSGRRHEFWNVEAVEFPVTLSDGETHIDIVLKHTNADIFLVVECKRVNPAFNCWAFVRSRRDPLLHDEIYYDEIRTDQVTNLMMRTAQRERAWADLFDHGVTLPNKDQKGDSKPKGDRDSLKEAVYQSMRGVSGLLGHEVEMAQRQGLVVDCTRFIPVVITTAELWGSNTDLSQADTETGELTKPLVNLRKLDYLWYSHNRSRSLIPGSGSQNGSSLREWLLYESTRTVAVVNAAGIERFLKSAANRWVR